MTVAEQVRAVKAGAGWLAWPERGVLSVAGGDRERWLDGMVSNDVRALEVDGPGAACRALLLTPQGRIVGDLAVWARADAYLLEMARAVLGSVHERLDKYVIADDVTLRDRSDDFAHFRVEGPRAAALVGAVLGREPETAAWAVTYGAGEAAGVGCIARSLTDLGGFHLLAPAAKAVALEDALRARSDAGDAVALSSEALEVLRIEGGVPWQGREIDDTVLPAEARLDEAVSETKGCYTGQEVVARMRSRGRVGHHLVGLRVKGAPPAPGVALAHAGRKVGEITSAAESPDFGAIALGYVRRDHHEPGTELSLDGATAVVSALPFSDAAVPGEAAGP